MQTSPVKKHNNNKRDPKMAVTKDTGTPLFSGIYNSIESKGFLCLYILVAIISIIVFKDFIISKKLYLFTDIGSDSINTFWPGYTLISDYLKDGQFPGWSFQTGMGQNIFPQNFGDPFRYIYYLSDRNSIPFLIFFVELFKILIATGLFYAYLKIINLNTISSVIGALLFGFSGYMIIGSGWYIFSTEVVYVALLLYSFELFYQNGKWLLFTFSIALIAAFGPFNLYLNGLFIFVYSVVRYYNKDGAHIKQFLLMEAKLFLAGIIGLGISALFFIPAVDLYLQSPRVEGDSALFGNLSSVSIFSLSDGLQLWTALLRTFAPDFLGNGTDFKGWSNYLEAPVFYCGTLVLLLFPQIFLNINNKRKITYGLLLSGALTIILFPYFRYLFWLFAGDYYRTFSLYVTLILIFFSVKSLHYLITKQKLNIWLLLITSFLMLIILYLIPDPIDRTTFIDEDIKSKITLLILLLTGILSLIYISKTRYAGALLLLLLVTAELTFMTYSSVNNRKVLTSEKLKEKTGYNDFTNEAIDLIKSRDNGFYRVSKDYFSNYASHVSLNDARMQNFYGTSSYHSFNQKYYIEFLNGFDIIDATNEEQTRWAKGLIENPLLQSFASVKYNLSQSEDPDFLRFNYKLIGSVGNIKILENNSFIPLGYTYNTYIKRSVFEKLSTLQKDMAVYKAFVIDDDSYKDFSGYNEFLLNDTTIDLSFENLDRKIAMLEQDTLRITSFSQNKISGTIDTDSEKLLFFSIPYDKGWKAILDDNDTDIHIVNAGMIGIKIPKGQHSLVLKYFPPYVVLGAFISAIMLIAALCLFYFKRTISLL